MKRSILLSLLVIGTSVALLAGGATFSSFTGSDSDSGDVAAGTVIISVQGSGASLDFNGNPECPDNLAPGDSCSDTVTVTNVGTLEVSLAAPVPTETGTLETCGDGDNLTTAAGGYSGDGILAAGESETFNIAVTLEGDATDDCQGDIGTVDVSVTATNT